MDGSPPGSPIQARTLAWVAISFSSAWKWKVKVKSLSCVWLLATPWTAAYQAPPSMAFSRQEYWSGVPLPSPYLRLEILKYTLLSYRANRSSSQLLKKEEGLLRSKGNNSQISSRIPLITVKPRVGSRETTTGGFCQSVELQWVTLASLPSDSQIPACNGILLGRGNENLEGLLTWFSLRSSRVPVHIGRDEKPQLNLDALSLNIFGSPALWAASTRAWRWGVLRTMWGDGKEVFPPKLRDWVLHIIRLIVKSHSLLGFHHTRLGKSRSHIQAAATRNKEKWDKCCCRAISDGAVPYSEYDG